MDLLNELPSLLTPLATLFVTIDPIGLMPIFLALTAGMSRAERRTVALRGSLIAFAILLIFVLFGAALLSLFGISLPAFRVAGGLLLFVIAFEMIFERRERRKASTAAEATTRDDIENLAVFPLAIPLLSGPGAISAVILLADRFSSIGERIALIGILGLIFVFAFLLFSQAHRLDNIIGTTGRSVLTRLLGVILSALAVQFVADGIIGISTAQS